MGKSDGSGNAGGAGDDPNQWGDESTAKRVGLAAERVVLERENAAGNGRRDVHRKHHGLVWAEFTVRSDLEDWAKHGVFIAGTTYKAWVRFSSSSKRAQSDVVADGRGVAIKLLAVRGTSWNLNEVGATLAVQDFIFLNGPAFFAGDSKSMAVAAEKEADDQFPSDFFVTAGNLRGLAALAGMAQNQAESSLDLQYFSQAPYRLGPDGDKPQIVKYRLRPLHSPTPRREGVKSPNYLFEALRRDLTPPAAKDDPEAPFEFDFEVQFQGADPLLFPVDDATVVWDERLQPFVPIARLTITRQKFDTEERMELAENFSFNPWNGLSEHLPVGSINRARLHAYRDSKAARYRLNCIVDKTDPEDLATKRRVAPELDAVKPKKPPQYTVEEWENNRNIPGKPWTPPDISGGTLQQVLLGTAMLFPRLGRGLQKILSSYAFPAGLLIFMLAAGRCGDTPWYCQPMLLGALPSENAIPEAGYTKQGEFAAKLAARQADPVWVFRYAPVGAEGNGGTPYWIFRVLPGLFPQYFGNRKDWSEFGLQQPDNKDYYEDYHGLPRGLVLTEPVASLGGNQVGLGLKLVTFNCASCHRGEVTGLDGKPMFFDGMPNLALDAAGYKRAVFRSLRDDGFTAARVEDAIDALMAEEHQKHPKTQSGQATPSALTLIERGVYDVIIAQARNNAWAKPVAWMDARPDNGPGRLDAFGALRFEFLGYDFEAEHIATVDLPSIWHQQSSWRPWHHYDGNTEQTRARNFGAIVGIGGLPETLRKATLLQVGDFIDQETAPPLNAPHYPFPAPPEDLRAHGQDLYEKAQGLLVGYPNATCASCHGLYDSNRNLLGTTACMKDSIHDFGTDPYRYQALDQDFITRLNQFGANNTLWGPEAFRKAEGYICPPLDAIWARAPYLHNGSVPTLWDLLGIADKRAKEFFRGNPLYDQEKGGFFTTPPTDRAGFRFLTTERGNSNAGHDIKLGDSDADIADRKALIAYLLSL